MKPRRRTILKVIALLIAGATLNVAVAWGQAKFIDWPLAGPDQPLTLESWPMQVPQHWPAKPDFSDEYTQVGASSIYSSARIRPRDPTSSVTQWTGKFGTPTKSMAWSRIHEGIRLVSKDPFNRATRTWREGWQPDAISLPGNQALPLIPLWPGFAVNTLFYAGVLWVLCCGPFALRRMIRRRRGRCPHCNYPIGQSPVCTECGAAVTPKAVGS